MDSFDYIVVGAGTAGLVVANRLSENPSVNVAVIEPGTDQRDNPNVTNPDNFQKAFNTAVDWNYTTVKQPGAGDRALPFRQGKAWGGTSTINGMTYIRGDVAEVDAWEQLGNPGWNWGSLLPYYKKSEGYINPDAGQLAAGVTYDPRYHGCGGPVHVGYPATLRNGSFAPVIMDTWEVALSMELNPDVNGGRVRGLSVGPQTMDPEAHLRYDAARAYYYPVERRPNLKILRGTVKRIVWLPPPSSRPGCDADRLVARGVEVLADDGATSVVYATREVIISAGAVRTPLVLEASGVGNPRILEALGIETVIDLPGVGENLIEQTNYLLGYTGTLDSAPSAYFTFATAHDLFGDKTTHVEKATLANIPEWAQATVHASGDRSLSAAAVEKLLRIQHDLIFRHNVSICELLTISAPGGALLSNFWALLPFSRGSVHLGSIDEIDKPLIDPRFYLVDFDVVVMTAIGRLARKFWSSDPVRAFVTGQLMPDPEVLPPNATDSQWRGFLRDNLIPNSHALGTASMMAKELGGVVDPELRVYGTANVRVVDASVMPLQISGHLTATIYALAERAVDIIKRDGREKSLE